MDFLQSTESSKRFEDFKENSFLARDASICDA